MTLRLTAARVGAVCVALLASGHRAVAAQQASSVPQPVVLPFSIDGPLPPTLPETVARDAQGRVTVRAVRLSVPLQLDGRLDEPVYGDVLPASDFVQSEPLEGAPATQKTEIWVLFDDDHVYIVGRCWESHPERMVVNDMRRDGSGVPQNERLGFVLDTFYDRRNGLSLNVTPIGGRNDGEFVNERTYNEDWNPVYDFAVGRFEGGWTAEVALPFTSLRYRPGRAQIWGFNITRFNKWKNEASYLAPHPGQPEPHAGVGCRDAGWP